MPLFGRRNTKKNEQNQIETGAGEAKTAVKASKRAAKPALKEVGAQSAGIETKTVAMPKGSFGSGTEVILHPYITEKTGIISQNGVYTFRISEGANKNEVAKAVRILYKVTPVKVGIINVPSKNVFVRGKKGVVSGMRKAMVTIKKGEKIEFI